MSAILKEVEELGRMPNRFKTPKNNEERAEHQLSKRIAQHKNDFPKDVWEDMCQRSCSEKKLAKKLARRSCSEKRRQSS